METLDSSLCLLQKSVH
uniref:Uncharacterized protein n=1 Tax=Anguilla anguilla TaxID=7936 RepID=A0A0E9S3P1_ANGAN